MTSTVSAIIEKTLTLVFQRKLGDALRIIVPLYRERPTLMGAAETEHIASDFRLMLDYMERGFQDPQRDQLYDQLLMRLYQVAFNLMISWRCKNVTVYVESFRRADRLNMSHSFLKSVLEGFVSDVAMLSLEPEERQAARSSELYIRHQKFMCRLFCSLFISLRWQPDDLQFYRTLLLSPTIDRNDQLLIVSAVTLAVMNLFDPFKWQLLFQLCQQSHDEELRQRALVGMVLSAPPLSNSLFSRLREEYRQYFVQPAVARELLQLQCQLFYCVDAERDTQKIQSDIMPTIIKHSRFEMTRFGIKELEENELENILNPDADDKAMEEVENSVQRMMQMQKAGSDIFFGGFSQMKNFPFFNEFANWFCPFFPEHPVLKQLKGKHLGDRLVDRLVQSGPFCHSDKYSFALGVSQIYDRIPANLREMMSVRESFELSDESSSSFRTPAFIRRMYLQDLYRFFKLYLYHRDLANPFVANSNALAVLTYAFLFDHLYDDSALNNIKLELAKFLLKKKNTDDLRLLMNNFYMDDNAEYLLLYAYVACNDGRLKQAISCYESVLEKGTHIEAALKGMARTLMEMGEYVKAVGCYQKLLADQPEHKFYQMKCCEALLEDKRFDEALPIIYKLDFNFPDDLRIKRLLAWVQLNTQRLEQAEKSYRQIIGQPGDNNGLQSNDFLNAGYACWGLGKLNEAADFFRRYISLMQELDDSSPSEILYSGFDSDCDFFEKCGISETDCLLMIDLTVGKL